MSTTEWAELRVVQAEIEAEMIRALLEAEDIPVAVKSDLTRTIYPSLSYIRVYVPKESLEFARQLLDRAELEQ